MTRSVTPSRRKEALNIEPYSLLIVTYKRSRLQDA